jgi:hypothetical protein
MAQYIGVKQVTLTKPTIAQILEVEHEWQNDNPHADIRDLDLGPEGVRYGKDKSIRNDR